MSESLAFDVELEQLSGYEFKVTFDNPQFAALLLDEPAPLGGDKGPNASRLIGAAVANCLSASLVFCLSTKFKQPLGPLKTKAHGTLIRNEKGRLRIGRLDVTIQMAEDAAAVQHLERCLAQFEDFCVVTESVRHGIAVGVRVIDAGGAEVFAAPS
jgi:organic hydroperoxide reductase OsmC/OhrA